tara:strand:- start:798 stop:1430 length:633 start_codon:yes stop_codon:yes gene_type:complete
MKKRKKLFGIDLDSLIESVTLEALLEITGNDNYEAEELKQKKKADQMRGYKATKKKENPKDVNKNNDQNTDEAEEQEKSKGLKPVSPKKSELPTITMVRVIEKIDSIRAGKSLKDKLIKKELNDYWSRLNGNERIALYAFLTGLDKIMGGNADGDKLPTPKVDPYKIRMRKKKVDADKAPAKGSDSPIIVGEAANKSREKLIINRNLRKK